MGRQSRIKNERRVDQAGWVSFSPHLTRRVMGAARLSMRREDVQTIAEMVSTASPAAHAYFAPWDSAAVGVSMEIAVYDIAYMAAYVISGLRTRHSSITAVVTTVDVIIGDWDVRICAAQASRRGDVTARIAETHLHTWSDIEREESEFLAAEVKRGARVLVFGADGTMVDVGNPGSAPNF